MLTYIITEHDGFKHLAEVRYYENAVRQVRDPEKGFQIEPINSFHYEEGRVDDEAFEELQDEAKKLQAEVKKLNEAFLAEHQECVEQFGRAEELEAEVERLTKRNQLLTDHYECKMDSGERVSYLEAEVESLREYIGIVHYVSQYEQWKANRQEVERE